MLADELDAYFPGSRLLLEVGVGTGIVAGALAGLGRTVVGVDLSAEMLGRAQERLGPRVAQADAHALPAPAEAVDAAYLVWVLHLVSDPCAVVAECARVLRRGGRLAAVIARTRNEQAEDMTVYHEALDVLRSKRSDTPGAVVGWAAAAGLKTVAERQLKETYPERPVQMAEALEKRTYSFVWDLDDDTWHKMVQPVIDGLRALPDPDRPRQLVQYRDVLVFEK